VAAAMAPVNSGDMLFPSLPVQGLQIVADVASSNLMWPVPVEHPGHVHGSA